MPRWSSWISTSRAVEKGRLPTPGAIIHTRFPLDEWNRLPYAFSVGASIPEGCQTLAGGRSEAETTGLLGKRVGTLAGVPEIKLSADSATPPGSNPSPDAFRGLRPSALPPPNIWQPFRLLGIEDFALALNTYRLGRSLFQAVGLPGGDRLLLWQQRRVRLPQKGKQIRQALHGQALFQAVRHE